MTNRFQVSQTEPHRVPSYISSLYRGFYMNKGWADFLDADWFATLSTFGFYSKLKRSLLEHIKPKSWTLMVGNSYGWLVKDIAAKVGDKGLFEVIDAVPIQAESAGEKLSPWPHFKSIVKDIEHYHPSKKYDTIVCYFLLHEMPDKKKKRVIKNIASLLALNGRAVFIDYGTASKYHPLKYLLRAYNNIFEPFADSLFKTGIKDFTDDDNLHFVTKTFFGGLYQKTIMTVKKG